MLNAYPDSLGGTLGDIVNVLKKPEFEDVFQSFYVLPSLFNTDLDRGFSVIDYGINEALASKTDLEELKKAGLDLKLDFVLNHLSVLSGQFQDILKNGENSRYKDFFINWNGFWDGYGEMTEEGYIQPQEEWIKNMFFRKAGLPLLMVRIPDGTNVPYWNTFYQEVQYGKLDAQSLMEKTDIQYLTADLLAKHINSELKTGKKPKEIDFSGYEKYKIAAIELLEENRRYLGQMDLNIKSELVWEYYKNTLRQLSEYGAKIVRLDAFAYACKGPGKRNFFNIPETWDLLEKVRALADKYGIELLPEIHADYKEKIYEKVAEKGYMIYDFFLPGLLLYAIEKKNGMVLKRWAEEIQEKKIRTVNMLGCHDGIPLLDLKGFLPDEEIENLIAILVDRGGCIKNLHGQKMMYYQVNATYFSALGENEKKLLFARAIQLFMPGKPQVWYLDLLAGRNDYEAVKRAGSGGHKEINRTNLSVEQVEGALKLPVVKKQLELLRFRNTYPAFGFESNLEISVNGEKMEIKWSNKAYEARLIADFMSYDYEVIRK